MSVHCNAKHRKGKQTNGPTVTQPSARPWADKTVDSRYFFKAAWAAARRAIGTRNGEQLT
jgi:hypothetical protein